MTYLLDVNVLIALLDPAHVAHDAAQIWFARRGAQSWATCPITENGVIRIVGHPRYPTTPGSPAAVAAIITEMRKLPGHCFWPDNISLVASASIDIERLTNSAQLTDVYLVALAQAYGGQLATFDRKLTAAAVSSGRTTICQVPTDLDQSH